MKTQRRTADEQYQLIMECCSSGLSDYQWCTEQSKKKTSFLYFETMFSYLNQILIRENKTNELAEILPNVDIVELLKLKNIKLFLKFLYLKIKGKLYKI